MSSSASQASSSIRPLLGSIWLASRGDIPKNSESKPRTSSRNPPRRLVIFARASRSLKRPAGWSAINSHSTTGAVQSFSATHVSYMLGLRGPSMAVDSACSSSLLAVQLACQSIRSGECTLALAGGVNLMLAAETTVAISKLGALSPDGRCWTFDARANGYVRGEGGGIVVLKPHAQARRDGDRIYGLILGTAVNNDGPSNGMTAPSAIAQEALIREACARGGVDPGTVGYVELHGTGTALGDPIEAAALGATYGQAQSDGRRLLVGSLKTGIGHLEAVAGIAGLIKALLTVQRRTVFPSFNFERPNPHIDLAGLRLEVATATQPFAERPGVSPRAGVSSFGLGGTNAHVIVEAAAPQRATLVALAAPREADLLAEARAIRASLARETTVPLRGLATGQGRLRAAVTGDSVAALIAGLDALTAGQDASDLLARGEVDAPRDPVFVFSGMGSQWLGMGQRLFAEEPVYRAEMERCEVALQEVAGRSVLEPLFDDRPEAALRDPDAHRDYNPVVVATQIAHAALWRSWGVRPSWVTGHCIGEVAAAHVAGILEHRDAMRVIAAIADLYQRTVTAQTGLAAFVAEPPAGLAPLLAQVGHRVAVACDNDPGSCVVSGEVAAVRTILAALERRGVFVRLLSNVLTHCVEVAPFLEGIAAALRDIRPRPAHTPMFSTTRAARVTGPELDGAYWAENIREPVRFTESVEALAFLGATGFLELSAHAVLARSIEATLARLPQRAPVLRAQDRQVDGHAQAIRTAAAAYSHGFGVDPLRVMGRASGPEGLPGPPRLYPLSARSEGALLAAAAAHARRLDPTGDRWDDLARAVSLGRQHHEHRLAVLARDAVTGAAALSAVARGEAPPHVWIGKRAQGGAAANVAFAFAGHGAQWAGMALDLRESEPVFREALERCDAALRAEDGFALIVELERPPEASRLDAIDVVQRAIFGVQVALAALWRSWGVAPVAVVGHSLGEVAAAHVAGALDLPDAARVICARSRLIRELGAESGGMLAVPLRPEAARRYLGEASGVVIGAHNGPASVVFSGPRPALAEIQARLEAEGVAARPVKIGFAAHGPAMRAAADALRRQLRGLRLRAAGLPFFSTVTGTCQGGQELDADYWARNVAEPVAFASTVLAMAREGHRAFLEIGGHPVLAPAIEETLEAAGGAALVTASMRRNKGAATCLLEALARIYCHGCEVDWRAVHRGAPRVVLDLPSYPWQQEPCWLEPPSDRSAAPGIDALLEPQDTQTLATGLAEAAELSAPERSLLTKVLRAVRRANAVGGPPEGWHHRIAWVGAARGPRAWSPDGLTVLVAPSSRGLAGRLAARMPAAAILNPDIERPEGRVFRTDLEDPGAIRRDLVRVAATLGAPVAAVADLRMASSREDEPGLGDGREGERARADADVLAGPRALRS